MDNTAKNILKVSNLRSVVYNKTCLYERHRIIGQWIFQHSPDNHLLVATGIISCDIFGLIFAVCPCTSSVFISSIAAEHPFLGIYIYIRAVKMNMLMRINLLLI